MDSTTILTYSIGIIIVILVYSLSLWILLKLFNKYTKIKVKDLSYKTSIKVTLSFFGSIIGALLLSLLLIYLTKSFDIILIKVILAIIFLGLYLTHVYIVCKFLMKYYKFNFKFSIFFPFSITTS